MEVLRIITSCGIHVVVCSDERMITPHWFSIYLQDPERGEIAHFDTMQGQPMAVKTALNLARDMNRDYFDNIKEIW